MVRTVESPGSEGIILEPKSQQFIYVTAPMVQLPRLYTQRGVQYQYNKKGYEIQFFISDARTETYISEVEGEVLNQLGNLPGLSESRIRASFQRTGKRLKLKFKDETFVSAEDGSSEVNEGMHAGATAIAAIEPSVVYFLNDGRVGLSWKLHSIHFFTARPLAPPPSQDRPKEVKEIPKFLF